MKKNKYAVIMAGGGGERFWPLSRQAKPKYLHSIVGEKSLLEQTVERISLFVDTKNIFIIAGANQIPEISKLKGVSECQIVAEPFGKDTSAAIAFASRLIEMQNENAVFGVFPSDSVVGNSELFAKTLELAYSLAEAHPQIVCVGIRPSFPATGYGYIEAGDEKFLEHKKYFKVNKFVEKPKLELAKCYLERGNYFWNAGIFVWSVSTVKNALQKNAPEIWEQFANLNTNSTAEDVVKAYTTVPKISIDFSVMEKAKNISVVEAMFDWDDVGSWPAVRRHKKADENGNIASENSVFLDAKNVSLVDTQSKLIAVLGVDNITVVNTPDALLVCKTDRSEDLKILLKQVDARYK